MDVESVLREWIERAKRAKKFFGIEMEENGRKKLVCKGFAKI